MSLQMQIHLSGSQFSYEEMEGLMGEIGFTDFQRIKITGYTDVLIGVKKAVK